MKAPLLILRDKKTTTGEFRKASNEISGILAKEVSRRLHKKEKNVVIVPILRAGLALLPAFIDAFREARVGFIGLKRDEKTFKPKEYYKNIPKISKSDMVIVLDPMLATGSSAVACIEALIKAGAREESVTFVGVISAPEGLINLQKHFPRIDTVIAVHDEKLDKHKYIVPGLGDFGDRYFGG
ncbi:MAG: uracil phosphoribosyltransferase [Patescibacteria group bacterium]